MERQSIKNKNKVLGNIDEHLRSEKTNKLENSKSENSET
jgi:hypothetical protein